MSESLRWDRAIQAVLALDGLEADWDGQGAVAPLPDLVREAAGLCRRLWDAGNPGPSTVVATPAGSVLFTWDNGGVYREAEVAVDGIKWMFVDGTNPVVHGYAAAFA